MKKMKNYDLLPLGVLLLSLVGFALRTGLYATGLDGKNLLVRWHPLEAALWVCTAAAAALCLASARQGYRVQQYAANFEGSVLSAFGHILAGSGILLTVLQEPVTGIALIGKLWKVAGMVCCPALYWAAFCRARGVRPFFGTYGLVSIFFALHLVANYQTWCADPQLQNYVFAFLAALMLMLFAYYQTAFCIDGGSSFLLRLTGLLAAYCCLTALAAMSAPYLYGGCAVWALTGLSRIRPRREKKAGSAHDSA